MVNYHQKLSSFLSTGRTLIAFKDKDSYLATQQNKGYSLLEAGKEIVSKKPEKCNFYDVEYASGYYFLYEGSGKELLRKSIDGTSLERWYKIDLTNGWGGGKCIRVALKGQALAVNRAKKNISILEILLDGSVGWRIDIEKDLGGHLWDHQVFGEAMDLVLSLTNDGWIVVHHIDLDGVKATQRCKYKTQFTERVEETSTIAVCPKNRFLMVHTRVNTRASRVLIMEFFGDRIQQRSSFDVYQQNIKYFHTAEFYGYVGNLLLLTAITWSEPMSKILSFSFDPKKGELVECGRFRKEIKTKKVRKLVKVDDVFFYSDLSSNLVMIKYSTSGEE